VLTSYFFGSAVNNAIISLRLYIRRLSLWHLFANKETKPQWQRHAERYLMLQQR